MKLRVKSNYGEAGRLAVRLGPDVEVNGRPWTPCQFDDEEDPTWFKPEGFHEVRQMDPDFRKDPKTAVYCCCCQKDLKESTVARRRVTVDWNTWAVWEDPNGESFIGEDCWKKSV